YVFIFFFQAEDGIRDFHVTGVQTCALPILSSFNASVSYKCHEIASPSRSSSEANQTVSAALANFFNSLTTAFLSEGTSYFCSKLFATSIASSVFTKSRI